jgi:integrase
MLSGKPLLEYASMPRQPKPFFHRGWWVTDVGGERTKLAAGRANRKQAVDELRQLLAKVEYAPEHKTLRQLAVWELCDQFLDWVKIHRAEKTYSDYHDWLTRWVKLHGKRRARDIRPLDLEKWKAALVEKELKPCTVNHAIIAVQTAWSWGVKNEVLAVNPLAKVEKLFAEGRQRILTPDEFRSLLRHSDALFRQILLVFRLTGARPSEVRKLTWEQVNWENHCWVIRRHKTTRTAKQKNKPRIIPMPLIVERLLLWRLTRYGQTERVFLNCRRKPWTINAFRCRMRCLRDKAGLKPDANGESIVMYTTRHSFATAAIAAGVTDRRLSELLGHQDPKMTQKYVHLAHSDLYAASQQATKGYMSPK